MANVYKICVNSFWEVCVAEEENKYLIFQHFLHLLKLPRLSGLVRKDLTGGLTICYFYFP